MSVSCQLTSTQDTALNCSIEFHLHMVLNTTAYPPFTDAVLNGSGIWTTQTISPGFGTIKLMLSWPEFKRNLNQTRELGTIVLYCHPKQACSTPCRKDTYLSEVVPFAKMFHENISLSALSSTSSRFSLNDCLHPEHTLVQGSIFHSASNKNLNRPTPAHPTKGIWVSECLKVIISA